MCPVDAEGCFTEEVADWTGRFVKDADKEIIRRLKQEHRLYPQAIRWLAQGRVSLNGEQLLFDQQKLDFLDG